MCNRLEESAFKFFETLNDGPVTEAALYERMSSMPFSYRIVFNPSFNAFLTALIDEGDVKETADGYVLTASGVKEYERLRNIVEGVAA